MCEINGLEIVDKIVKGELKIDIDDDDFPFNKAILSRESLIKNSISLNYIDYDVFDEELETSEGLYNFEKKDEFMLIAKASQRIFNTLNFKVSRSVFDMNDGLNMAWSYFVADATRYWEHFDSVFWIPPKYLKLDQILEFYVNRIRNG